MPGIGELMNKLLINNIIEQNLIIWNSELIIANNFGPCIVCGCPTTLVDIFVEDRICSESCSKQVYHEIAEYERTHPFVAEF